MRLVDEAIALYRSLSPSYRYSMDWKRRSLRKVIAALAIMIATLAPGSGNAQFSDHEHRVFADPERDIYVLYDFVDGAVVFRTRIPKGWLLAVNLDGDQDKRWGIGVQKVRAPIPPGPDHGVGTYEDGICGYYIYAEVPENPARVSANSQCDRYPTKAKLEITTDADDWQTISMSVPFDEVFGGLETANIQVCVWDTRSDLCQGSPLAPRIIQRPHFQDAI